MKRLLITTFIISILISSGCASIVSDSKYDVGIKSTPDGVPFEVTNKAGVVVAKGITPDSVTLKAGCGYFKGQNYVVKFNPNNSEVFYKDVERKLDPWYTFGNFFIGGAIGYLVVDPITGAMWKLDNVTVLIPESKQ